MAGELFRSVASRETQCVDECTGSTADVAVAEKVRFLHRADVQTVTFIIVALCTVGPYNGLNALGGGGLKDHLLATKVNCVYSFSLAVFGWMGGAIFSYLGARRAVCLASFCYASYVAVITSVTFLEASTALVYPCGLFLGLGGAMMWASFGAISIRYSPIEHQSRTFALMWGSMNLGGFLCGMLSFISNSSSDGHQASLISYTLLGSSVLCGTILSALGLRHQETVIRSDGQKVDVKRSDGLSKIMHDAADVFKDRNLRALWPIFSVPFAHMPFLFNGMNSQYFNIRTRSLNSSLYWGARIPGGFIFYLITKQMSPPLPPTRQSTTRNKIGMPQLFPGLYLTLTWAGVCLVSSSLAIFVDSRVVKTKEGNKLDFKADAPLSLLLMSLFVGFGMLDAFVQSFLYNVLAVLTGENTKAAAVYSGFYKSMQSFSLGIFWFSDWMLTALAGDYIPTSHRYKIHLIAMVILWIGSIPGAFLTLKRKRPEYEKLSGGLSVLEATAEAKLPKETTA